MATCSDLTEQGTPVTNRVYVCEECVKTGSRWLHLRTCQSCGAVLCCDSSPNRHARAHYHSTAHRVMASAEPGERWLYCWLHGTMAGY